MSWNPFIIKFKEYPGCMKATALSGFCSYMQRMFLLFGPMILLVVFVEQPTNMGEGLSCGLAMVVAGLVIRKKKDGWCEYVFRQNCQHVVNNDASESVDARRDSSQNVSPSGTINYCPECGTKIEDNCKFCSNCGYKLL